MVAQNTWEVVVFIDGSDLEGGNIGVSVQANVGSDILLFDEPDSLYIYGQLRSANEPHLFIVLDDGGGIIEIDMRHNWSRQYGHEDRGSGGSLRVHNGCCEY